jgi:site-specific DNA-methyltransferase (adenine-specific)
MIELLNIDCMEYMAGIPNNSFDLAIVDPPYGINGNSHRRNKIRGRMAKSNDYHMALWDQPIPTQDYFKELFRVSKNQIVFGANYFEQIGEPQK